MNRTYHAWHSPNLGRTLELLVFGHSGARVLIFPTRAGRFYDYENWGMIEALRPKIEQGQLQLFCLDSVDASSFYCDWCAPADRIAYHLRYEAYLLHEVLPFTQLVNPHTALISHGCSMGAFHALNFGLRHPQHVAKIVALSGRYDLTQPVGDFRDLFDGYYSEDIYFNTPSHYVPNLQDAAYLVYLRGLDITIIIGEADPFLENNQQLSQALWDKGIWHNFQIWSGRSHKPRHWVKMVHLYL
ncbi:MAG: esterase family protein [Roseiflexaceae bacterium]|nr:esterase family protein [Roseiflexaceae bacterium]